MKQRYVFAAVLILIGGFTDAARADDIKADSKITAATVYNDRATLTRSARIEIPAGKHDIVLSGLPATLFPDSLRAAGKSGAKVTFGAVSNKLESSADYVQPKEQELNDKLEQLQDKRNIYVAEKSALQAAKDFLLNLGKQASLRSNEDIAEINLKPDTWGGAADVLSTKLAENLKSSNEKDIAIRGVDKDIRKTQNELNQLRTGQKQSYTVTIPYESNAATTLDLELSYQISGVSWQPVYDARLNVKTGEMELVQYGSVWQQTGEDWNNIDLTLSTGRPSRGTSLPDLQTDWLWIRNGQNAQLKAVAFRVDSGMAGAMKENALALPAGANLRSMASAPMTEEATFAPAQINTEGFVGEYKIVGKSDVKSDGTHSKVMIGSFKTENKQEIQIKPQYAAEAYLVVKSTLKGDAPILPGQVNLFRDDAFIGKTHLPMMRPGDEEELSFGIDDNVSVRRNTLKDERSEAGMITKDTVIERHVVTEIQNLHKTPVDIAVLETVPVSKDERIRAGILKDKTTPGYETDIDDVKGLTRWRKSLQPSEKTRIDLTWRVSWPKDENIGGL